MKNNRCTRMNAQIYNHGQNLIKIFNLDPLTDAFDLAKKIHRIEVKARRLSTDYCNGVVDMDQWEKETEKILKRVQTILGDKVPVFVNGDARGYALKIDGDYVYKNGLNIPRDFGGYGILAPEFDGRS